MATFNFSIPKKSYQSKEEQQVIDDIEWFDIPGYNLYKISKTGIIRRIAATITNINGTNNFIKSRILKTKTNKSGYISVTLTENGKQKGEFIHVLLAKTFIPNLHNYPIVNHKDENPSNNSIDNLEWCNHSYNAKHSIETIRKAHQKEQRRVIRINIKDNTITKYDGIREAARDNNTNHNNIRYAILHNGICAGYKWSYETNTDKEKSIIKNNIKEKRIIYVKNIITNEIKTFDNVNNARMYMNISQTHYYRLIKKGINEYYKFQFWFDT